MIHSPAATLPPCASIADDLLTRFDEVELDRKAIPQDQLDLRNRSRRSILPWRGQFSPELIELLLSKFVTQRATQIVDPFVGSGTTLVEAASRDCACYGADVNPAAALLASSFMFVNATPGERRRVFAKAKQLIEIESLSHRTIPACTVRYLADQSSEERLLYSFVANVLIRFSTSRSASAKDLVTAFFEHRTLIEQLPFTESHVDIDLRDARDIPLDAHTVDLVLTSPPYINVFNYHQNYRPTMEALGWDVLHVARSEFGSNRKHRGNRFLTVVQYALDMFSTLVHMHHLLTRAGRMIIVVGRESSVRGVPFENGRLVSALGIAAAFKLVLRQERRFTTKFGESIYEDILHFEPTGNLVAADTLARDIGTGLLCRALATTASPVQNQITDAIEFAATVQPSPVYKCSVDFLTCQNKRRIETNS